jgi:catechol 2,3-dioxygenase-like lactoylglutathione lyase family enzyme
MLARIDHVGYVVHDLTIGIATLSEPLELRVTLEFELAQYSLRGAFMTGGEAVVEAVEYTDPAIAQARLGGLDVRLDHVAYEVDDIERAATRLRARGVRFCAPDGSEIDDPVELRGARHLWTVPGTAPGVCLQLIER